MVHFSGPDEFSLATLFSDEDQQSGLIRQTAINRLRRWLDEERPFDHQTSPRRERDFQPLLCDRIFAELVLPKTTSPITDFKELAALFANDWETIQKRYAAWLSVLESAMWIDITAIDRDSRKRANAKLFSTEIRDEWRQFWFPYAKWPIRLENKLDASLAPLPIEQSRQILENNLSDTAFGITVHMESQLESLVQRRFFGEISWFGANACQYRFWRREGKTRAEKHPFVTEVEVDCEAQQAWQVEQHFGATDKSICCRIHDLVNAVEIPLEHSVAKFPRQVHATLDRVPDWMSDLLSVVEGALIRERHDSYDLGRDEWIRQYDRPIPCLEDPALVFAGRFVLAGWKGDEVQVEKQKYEGLFSLLYRWL